MEDKPTFIPHLNFKLANCALAECRLEFYQILHRVTKCTNYAVAREMYAKHRLTLPQFEVLSEVMRETTGVRLGELARRVVMTNGNMTRLVCRLEEEHYVRRKGTADKRISIICITPAGAELVSAATETHRHLVFTQIKASEVENVLAAANKAR